VSADAVIIALLVGLILGIPATFLAEAFGLPLSVAVTWRLTRLARRYAREQARSEAP